jgi:hypothetical protein
MDLVRHRSTDKEVVRMLSLYMILNLAAELGAATLMVSRIVESGYNPHVGNLTQV